MGVVVSAALHDVNFTRLGPGTPLAVSGHHPDGGPEPVTLGELSPDLDTAILDVGALLGGDTAGQDGGDNGGVSSGAVGHGDTRGLVCCCAGLVLEEIDLEVV